MQCVCNEVHHWYNQCTVLAGYACSLAGTLNKMAGKALNQNSQEVLGRSSACH